MLQSLHAVQISKARANGDLALLRKILTLKMFDNLVNHYRDSSFALFRTAEFTEDRAMMIADYANSVLALRCPGLMRQKDAISSSPSGLVRQKGALSSFHIPSNVISDPVWNIRYDGVHVDWFRKRVLREERLALGEHAKISGYRLIIDPHLEYPNFGPEARIVRLETLVHFLEEELTNKISQVAVMRESHPSKSILIVGDWFAAESVSAKEGQGYRQTVFTCHAPSMGSRIDLFDQEFAQLLAKLGWKPATSRESAIKYIQAILGRLRRKGATAKPRG